jgi:6-pyruvoyltetrahydropterin/6-carboxytetrahydropterin synthase
MGSIKLEEIHFSQEVQNDWADRELWEKIKRSERFINPQSV